MVSSAVSPNSLSSLRMSSCEFDGMRSSILSFQGDGAVREYAGGYSDYLRQRKGPATGGHGVGAGTAKPKKAPSAGGPPKPPTERNRLSYKDKLELEELPGRLAALEAEIEALEAELADPGLYGRDPDRFETAAARLDAARAELDRAEERWLELETRREALERAKAGAA